MLTPSQVDAYLARIGSHRGASLAELHAAHTRTIPFEDYDIHLGIPISFDVGELHDKIVGRRRGGFCYELNGLFAALLRALGHDVTMLSAFSADEPAEFDHMRLLVATADGPVLADVGQGGRWELPLPLVAGEHGPRMVGREGDRWFTATRTADGWQRDWTFTLTPRAFTDFAPRCRFQEHDPASHFRAHRVAVLVVDGGRIALDNGVFTQTGRPERVLSPGEELAVLGERFGITLPRPWY
ncbi:N-hydroxyarylamine O-acetyltransferase [Pseudonocardia thermophila]|uniref:N-hydroxyarylamine O-acetyltransferase n=1 Tax=Pseudonocardia thermophila TaxID=1848 RepID=A0A1M6SN98_PSETH|nr:arylamine N-acetyltransferase [Pseudonocardia thermophila]SHK46175.1 N-hydroxyarylamine O-acetyltransferase [Pseudonocardia thermophila]